MPDDLIPISREELIRDIKINLAAMAARREPGACKTPPFFAEYLVDRLLRAGLVPYRRENKALWVSAHTKFAGGRDG